MTSFRRTLLASIAIAALSAAGLAQAQDIKPRLIRNGWFLEFILPINPLQAIPWKSISMKTQLYLILRRTGLS